MVYAISAVIFSALDIEEHERVSCENLGEKRRRLEMLDSSFGTTIQPTLEKVEYKVRFRFSYKNGIFSRWNCRHEK